MRFSIKLEMTNRDVLDVLLYFKISKEESCLFREIKKIA